MPRLTPATIKHASRISRHLPLLLRECRDISSAQNELRWLSEFIAEKQPPSQPTAIAPILTGAKSAVQQKRRHNETSLRALVTRRARGEPLQYILGTQPFGPLDILCRPNVLIPRPDTETYTAEIARLWQTLQQAQNAPTLSIADFCCGTGCISLLLHSILKPPTQSHRNTSIPLHIRGFDISDHALALAKDNLQHNLNLNTLHETASAEVHFEQSDLLALSQQPTRTIFDRLRSTNTQNPAEPQLDIIISNPPYIDPKDFQPGGSTTKSVRKYEPELALVPPPTLTFEQVNRADQFYPALLHIASATRPKLLAMEVGDTAQALRVRDFCRRYLRTDFQLDHKGSPEPLIEIWKDDGSVLSDVHKRAHDTSLLENRNHTANAERDVLVNVDSNSDSDLDPDVECRAVVLWLDPQWILFRQRYLER